MDKTMRVLADLERAAVTARNAAFAGLAAAVTYAWASPIAAAGRGYIAFGGECILAALVGAAVWMEGAR